MIEATALAVLIVIVVWHVSTLIAVHVLVCYDVVFIALRVSSFMFVSFHMIASTSMIASDDMTCLCS